MTLKPLAPIKILLVDDHPVVLDGIRARLERFESFEIVGEASDGSEAIRKAEALQPDVMILDISLKTLNGIGVTRRLQQIAPAIKVLALTMHEDPDYVQEMVRADAKGYILKRTSAAEIATAIESVASGRTYYSPAISQYVDGQASTHTCARTSQPEDELSPRELEVLKLISEGLSNKETASRLHISSRTVEAHRDRLMRKLNIRSAAGLTKYAIRMGLINLD